MDNTAGKVRPHTVYFFGTCVVDLFFPGAGMAGINLLKEQGLKVIFPQGQSCCGQPAFNSGYMDEARSVAWAQVKLFPKDYPVILPSGSCAGMMKKHYPSLFRGTPQQAKAEDFSGRVYELTQFLVDILDIKLKDLGTPTKVTWHPSCHSQREMGVLDQPKSLLRQLANVEYVELPRERECCGFGGTFAVRQPEISAAMVTDKIDAVASTKADTVISGDCGCLLNIGGALEKAQQAARPKHIAEFLWERTHGHS
ncbi:MAG TPA: (Fe-S)-binding protein [Rhodospirillaceae bacterium]|nr:(Fe-S)-binding protein [Rhodospirillaceae bacterium]